MWYKKYVERIKRENSTRVSTFMLYLFDLGPSWRPYILNSNVSRAFWEHGSYISYSFSNIYIVAYVNLMRYSFSAIHKDIIPFYSLSYYLSYKIFFGIPTKCALRCFKRKLLVLEFSFEVDFDRIKPYCFAYFLA